MELVSELSPYYIISRDPNAGLRKPWKEIAQGTAQRLFALAERIVDRIKSFFDKETQVSS